MKGDFSRVTFDPRRHYSGVRMQQGRVQLDADWNEQVDITAHRIETEITDFVGQSGAPDGQAGFAISVTAAGQTPSGLLVGPGRYYVDGMLVEAEDLVAFTAQPDFPGAVLPTSDGTYLAYLDVWERHVTGLEDPRVVDPALAGADTATRIRTVAQVRLQLLTERDSKAPQDYQPPWQPPWDRSISSGTLAARVSAPRPTLENQLYRVEIHQGGGVGKASFKWSRDNGSVAAQVRAIDGVTISVRPTTREAQALFAPNQFVELVDEGQVLRGEPGVLAEVAQVQGDEVTVSGWPGGVVPRVGAQAVLRRWDSAPGEVPIRAGQLPLEDDIEVSFDTSNAAVYKSGDYWLIPSRHLTGRLDWPQNADDTPQSRGPHGTRHHYCALAMLGLARGQWTVVADLRVRFQPIATGLLTKAGGTVTGTMNFVANVGIGTASPAAGLEIDKGSTNDAAIVVRSSGAGFGSSVQFVNTSSTGGRRYVISSNATGSWVFSDETAGQARMVVNKAGDVCIGLGEAEQSRLHVQGVDVPASRVGTGTIRARASAVEVTGDRTKFTQEIRARDFVVIRTSQGTEETREVASVQSDTSLILTGGFTADVAGAAFSIARPVHLARLTDVKGATQALVSHDGQLEIRGHVFVGEAKTPVPFAEEGVRILRGSVNGETARGSGGRGFGVRRVSVPGGEAKGLYDVEFVQVFPGVPSAIVTLISDADFFSTDSQGGQFVNQGQNTKQNAVIVAISSQKMRVKTGDENGVAANKNFSFIVIGPR